MKRDYFKGFLLTIIFCFFVNYAFAEMPAKRHILVLNSYHKGLSWTDNTIKGIESVLLYEDSNIELHHEFMDTKRYFGETYFNKIYAVLKEKYYGYRFDAIITADNDALDFMFQYGNSLFPNTPVVFCGINNFQDRMLRGKPLYTGVVEETDMRATLEIAFKLHPHIKKVMVINDTTTTGLALKRELQETIDLFSDRAVFELIEDFTIEELYEILKKTPKNVIILMLVLNRDKKGQFLTYEESLSIVRKNSEAPIYGLWDFYIGKGIVGGMLTSGYEQGRSAGALVMQILKGKDVREIAVIKRSPNVFMFDYKELQRFNISLSNLPKDFLMVNEPDTLYTRYRNLIYTVLAIILTLSLVIVTLAFNIKTRKKTEILLRDSEMKYRDLYDNAPDMYHSVNKEGIVIDCNETEARMLGYEKDEIIGSSIADFLTEESKKQHEQEFPFVWHKGKEILIEREFVRKDGTTFIASLNVFLERDEKGELIRTKTIARDITHQKQIEEELKRSREELRNLSIHLQTAREQERRQIAREIHDELGHALTTLKLDLSWIKRRLSDNEQLISKLNVMLDLVDQTVNVIQRLSSELRPGVLDHLTLADAIEWQLKELQRRTDIVCSLKIEVDFDNIKLEQERITAIFRVFQEAITNVLRHAGATNIEVLLTSADNMLTLAIKDNGRGIDERQINDPNAFGIIGMRERAHFLGGELHINKNLDNGTTVTLKIPFQETT